VQRRIVGKMRDRLAQDTDPARQVAHREQHQRQELSVVRGGRSGAANLVLEIDRLGQIAARITVAAI
jgi:hypothetical protein